MLYRTTLNSPALGLRRELDRLMEETFGRVGATTAATAAWGPAMDITEDQDGLLVEFELPGMKADEVEITSEKGVLTVRGEKHAQRQREGARAVISERTRGKFVRSVQLPQGVDESKIDAEFADGLLRIRVPRTAMPQPRKVEIRTAAAAAPAPAAEQG